MAERSHAIASSPCCRVAGRRDADGAIEKLVLVADIERAIAEPDAGQDVPTMK